MAIPRIRLLLLSLAVASAASLAGHAAVAGAQVTFGLGGSTIGADVTLAQPTNPVRGQVAVYPAHFVTTLLTGEPPIRADVFDRPNGCQTIRRANIDYGGHNLLNQTNVPVAVFFDTNCQVPAPTLNLGPVIPAGYGGHVDVVNSFLADTPIRLIQKLGPLAIGAYAGGSEAVSAPVVIMPTPDGPLMYDRAPGGCKPLAGLLGPLVTHNILNNGTQTLRLFNDPLCLKLFEAQPAIPPGFINHTFLNANLFYTYTQGTGQQSRTTRARSACRRAKPRRVRSTTRGRAAKCKPAKRPASGTRASQRR